MGESALKLTGGDDFLKEVSLLSGQKIGLCFQCQKCSSGCPVAQWADLHPSQLLRTVQFGLRDQALASSFIWLCSGCETCGARCPNGIRTAAVVDALKEMADGGAERNMRLFHRAFLDSVRRYGRIHELGMLTRYKLQSGSLFQDLDLGRHMFVKGKLKVMPHRIKGTGAVRDIFRRVQAKKHS
ncbi:MAG: 4Fe-4S dicluster domain-containing protein [Peptococcaceae bacterium]|jgi:heterodisulfide reductase subunit C|nr:4Fe-4S dicluster domain-containing protein [Peptococcaceae bacterium]